MKEMSEATVERADRRMDQIMGRLLQTGVILAASVVLVGGILYLTRHRVPVTNFRVFQGEPAQLRQMSGILHEATRFSGRGLIQLGLLILIATPVARVGFSFLAFLYQRDWTYVAVTVVVLGLLFYSLLGGHA